LIVIFQPHRFTRLKNLMEKFSTAFAGVDILIITRLYAAGQKKIKNISGRLLAENIKKAGARQVHYLESFNEIIQFLKNEVRKGDAVAFLSAGDLTSVAHQYAKIMEKTGTGDGMK
jgi:UDP-N-acetylmuramate--alanine ligase